MKILHKFNGILAKLETFVLSWSVLVMASLLVANSVGRTLFHHSFKSVDDVCQFLILLTTFVGMSTAARRGSHVIMSAVLDVVPPKGKKVMVLLTSVGTLLFCIFLAYLSTRYTMQIFENGRITPALSIPLWRFMALIPLGFILTAFQYFLILMDNLLDFKNVYIAPQKRYESELEIAQKELAEENNPANTGAKELNANVNLNP